MSTTGALADAGGARADAEAEAAAAADMQVEKAKLEQMGHALKAQHVTKSDTGRTAERTIAALRALVEKQSSDLAAAEAASEEAMTQVRTEAKEKEMPDKIE